MQELPGLRSAERDQGHLLPQQQRPGSAAIDSLDRRVLSALSSLSNPRACCGRNLLPLALGCRLPARDVAQKLENSCNPNDGAMLDTLFHRFPHVFVGLEALRLGWETSQLSAAETISSLLK